MNEEFFFDLINECFKKFVTNQSSQKPFSLELRDNTVIIYINVNEIKEYRILKFTHSYPQSKLNNWFQEIFSKLLYPKIPKVYDLIIYYEQFEQPNELEIDKNDISLPSRFTFKNSKW